MDYLKVVVEEKIATITLNRPPANALSKSVLSELDQVLTELESNDCVNVLLLHGEGRFFAAGADIKEFIEAKNGVEFAQNSRNGQQLFRRMEDFPKPIIVAIHGAALGGGLELAMSCHIRLATDDAKLGLPELSLGLIPGFAGSQRLPRFVGTAKAAEMMLTSDPISGSEAKALGLVNASFASEVQLLEESRKLAKKIAAKSMVSVKRTLELLRYSRNSQQEVGSSREAELFGEVFDSADGKEGILAFIEKRSPKFQNK